MQAVTPLLGYPVKVPVGPLVGLLSPWLVPYWAPPPSDQLSVSDCWWSCSAIGWHGSGPLPQATNCQWVTVGGPAQSLVGQWAPPPRDQLSMSDCQLVHSANSQRSGGRQAEWGQRQIPLFSPEPFSSPTGVRPRPCGGRGEPLHHSCLCGLMSATVQ